MTVAQFLAWDAPGSVRWQLINGMPVAVAVASANGSHAVIQAEIARLLGNRLADYRSR